MGSIGNVGYGVYKISKRNLLVVSPKGSHLIKIQSTFEDLIKDMVEDAEEEDIFLDYKINKSGEGI